MIKRDINRKDKVSAEKEKAFNDEVISWITTLQHKMKSLIGKIKVLSECVTILNTSIIPEDLESTDENLYLTVDTISIYPNTTTEKVTIDKQFRCFYAGVINSQKVLTDSTGKLKPGYTIDRTSESLNYSAATAIIENSKENMVSNEVPYIMKFMCETPSLYDIQVTVDTSSFPVKANALKLIPLPARGAIIFNRASYNRGNKFLISDNYIFEDSNEIGPARKYSAYLHFRPVVIEDFSIGLSSELHSSEIGGVCLGISSIELLYNSYALKSYIGYKITFPENMNTINKLYIKPSRYYESINNITVRIYDTLDGFNNIDGSCRYISTSLTGIQYTKLEEYNDVYILIEIESINNTTPSFDYIQVGFDD